MQQQSFARAAFVLDFYFVLILFSNSGFSLSTSFHFCLILSSNNILKDKAQTTNSLLPPSSFPKTQQLLDAASFCERCVDEWLQVHKKELQ